MIAKRKNSSASSPTILQWSMACFGAAVTLAAVGVVTWEAMQPDRPSALSARIVAVETTPVGHVAEVEVTNLGMDTAAAVDIEARLGVETATATLDYVPGQGHATAHLRFDADPRGAAVSVKGWSAP